MGADSSDNLTAADDGAHDPGHEDVEPLLALHTSSQQSSREGAGELRSSPSFVRYQKERQRAPRPLSTRRRCSEGACHLGLLLLVPAVVLTFFFLDVFLGTNDPNSAGSSSTEAALGAANGHSHPNGAEETTMQPDSDSSQANGPHHNRKHKRTETEPSLALFPSEFMWGTATAAYQIEGAAAEDGRKPSIWDKFSAEPGKVTNGDSGKVACDHYHRFREDVRLIAALGTKYYRFSISWPRVLPDGSKGVANEKGLTFYSDLIDALLAQNIVPVVTLYHWDLPVSVSEATNGGWIGDGTVADEFAAYARLCFDRFGDRVKWWITLNEPWCSSVLGYSTGEHAPGKTDAADKDPYLAAHNLLRAHAKAARIYRDDFVAKQRGKLGITLNSEWSEPIDDSTEAQQGSKRDMDFNLGWFAHPIYKGDYPSVMRQVVGDRLPKFTDEELDDLKGSSDFFGLNHYSTRYARGIRASTNTDEQPSNSDVGRTFFDDEAVIKEDDPSWDRTDMGWAIVPWGLRKLLAYIQKEYAPSGGIIITENGLAAHEPNLSAARNDAMRISYYKNYISEAHKAIEDDKVDLRGYFLWSLMDNFEWAFGYSKRFGLYYVDYKTLEREPKPAVAWYAKVTAANGLELNRTDTVRKYGKFAG